MKTLNGEGSGELVIARDRGRGRDIKGVSSGELVIARDRHEATGKTQLETPQRDGRRN